MIGKYKQYWFLLVIFILLFGVGAISVFFSKHANDTEKFIIQKFGNQQINFANHLKSRIENSFEHVTFDLKFLLMHKGIYHTLVDIASDRYEGEISLGLNHSNHIAGMIAEMLSQPYYLYLVISDRSGNPKAIVYIKDGQLVTSSTDGMPPLPLAKLTPLEHKVATLSLRKNSLLPNNQPKDLLEVVETVVPLYDNDKHLGWAGIGINFTLVTDIISNQSDDEDNHNWIFDWDGRFIYCSFLPSAEYHAGEMELLKNTVPGSHEASTHEGESSRDLLSFVKLQVGENRWNIVVETELNYMTGYVQNASDIGMVLLTTILLIAVMGVFFLYRLIINREVSKKKMFMLSQIKESEEKYRSIFNSTPNPVFLLDERFSVIDKNEGATKTFYHRKDDLVGKSINKIIPGIESLGENADKLPSSVGGIKWDTNLLNASDELMHFNNSLTVVKDNSGVGKFYLLYMHNITELKILQDQLVQSEKLASIGEFIAGIAHEINNPMTGIIGYSEFLMTEAKDSGVRDDAAKINKEALRCSHIVSNLLTFVRQQKEEKSIINVLEAIDGSLEIIGYDIKSHNITVEKDIEPDLQPVYGDLFELEQVLLNIINNAIYFLEPMKVDKKIWFTVRTDNGVIKIKIENNGPPIDEDKLGKIFDPFFTTKSTGEGTGLGLSISHGIIRSHKGQLYAKNNTRGVEFNIELPVATKKVGG